MEIILYLIAVWNIVVFIMYGIDKLKAVKNWWRISEMMLLISAFLLGGVGAFFGMRIWWHKTKHTLFNVLVPVFAIMTLVVAGILGK